METCTQSFIDGSLTRVEFYQQTIIWSIVQPKPTTGFYEVRLEVHFWHGHMDYHFTMDT